MADKVRPPLSGRMEVMTPDELEAVVVINLSVMARIDRLLISSQEFACRMAVRYNGDKGRCDVPNSAIRRVLAARNAHG